VKLLDAFLSYVCENTLLIRFCVKIIPFSYIVATFAIVK